MSSLLKRKLSAIKLTVCAMSAPAQAGQNIFDVSEHQRFILELRQKVNLIFERGELWMSLSLYWHKGKLGKGFSYCLVIKIKIGFLGWAPIHFSRAFSAASFFFFLRV